MNTGGAYGGGKAGGQFDLITFVQRPTVILRALCWVCTHTYFDSNQVRRDWCERIQMRRQFLRTKTKIEKRVIDSDEAVVINKSECPKFICG